MNYSHMLDVAAPGIGLLFGLGMLCGSGLVLLVIVPLEAWVMHLIKWGTFKEALLPSLIMNIASSMVGGLLILVGLGEITVWAMLVALALSVAIEYGVLMVFRKGETRQNLKAALYTNALSYGLLIAYVVLTGI